ncbi:MAG: putative DNA binding domain-containing protein [Bacteroidota bacterium]|nr:putative DNA binding domain-containing protein [Bacteroidota bacterium]
MDSVKDLVERLNAIDECGNIEAKKASSIDRSIMETVCALSNEPGLGGGYILLGVEKDESSLFPYYTVCGIENPDKLKLDFATQCANMFNIPVRPEIDTEQMSNGKIAVKVFVLELPEAQKPLYFKNEGLPRGAFRRISSSDQRCTEDDLHIFYNNTDSLDSSIVKDSSIEDISDDAVDLYRKLRANVNPYAEELSYENIELLQALGCIKKDNDKWLLTYTGLLVFGSKMALRRLLPMVRVDYIRVPGNEWVSDPEKRFTTTDMRGPLIELVQRTFNAITDDLPKGFLLPEGQIQAESIGLPIKVLREAIVNAFIHRTYRENQPIQVIRYGNRIEIKNPGFSLKPEEELGEPGSKNRNPFIAAIFHETNLAETKGSGIRTMRTLMEQASMVPPTFESDHSANLFTTRLLLHHFLSEDDVEWLSGFRDYQLTDAQKRALIFVRETGAIDNPSYRQLNGCDSLKASGELRNMRDFELLQQKGKGRATYYIPDLAFNNPDLSAPAPGVSAPVAGVSAPPMTGIAPAEPSLFDQMPTDLQQILLQLGRRTSNKEAVEAVITSLCKWKELKISELSAILGRSDKYLLREFITPLRESNKLTYTIPDMPNHPEQAYKSV